MDLREVFKHSLGPLPWALAGTNGALTKMLKSKLADYLIKDVDPAEDVSPSAAWVVDGMAILQSLKAVPSTFGDLAELVLHVVTNPAALASRIDFVLTHILIFP